MEGDKSQRTKLIVAGVLLTAAVGTFVIFGREKTGLATDINFVCVQTGKSFKIDRDQIRMVPVTNPETGKATLLPCVLKDGGIFIDPHYRGSLKELEGDNKYVDARTLRVKTAP